MAEPKQPPGLAGLQAVLARPPANGQAPQFTGRKPDSDRNEKPDGPKPGPEAQPALAERLLSASFTGDHAAVKQALADGADVNARDAFGSALTLARYRGHDGIVKLLVEHGAQDALRPDRQITALEKELDAYREVAEALIGEVEVIQAKMTAGETIDKMTTRMTQEFLIDERVTVVSPEGMQRMHQKLVDIFAFLRTLGEALAEDRSKMERRIAILEDDMHAVQTALAIKQK